MFFCCWMRQYKNNYIVFQVQKSSLMKEKVVSAKSKKYQRSNASGKRCVMCCMIRAVMLTKDVSTKEHVSATFEK